MAQTSQDVKFHSFFAKKGGTDTFQQNLCVFPGFVRFCFLAALFSYETPHQKFIGKLFFQFFLRF